MDNILVDSSFLIAYYDSGDLNHDRAATFVKRSKSIRLIPEVTLPEVTFMIERAQGITGVARFLRAFALLEPALQTITAPDLQRSSEIMLTYRTARLDFVDCCIMALSERLNITQVATFDRRDFSIFYPRHCAYLELLP